MYLNECQAYMLCYSVVQEKLSNVKTYSIKAMALSTVCLYWKCFPLEFRLITAVINIIYCKDIWLSLSWLYLESVDVFYLDIIVINTEKKNVMVSLMHGLKVQGNNCKNWIWKILIFFFFTYFYFFFIAGESALTKKWKRCIYLIEFLLQGNRLIYISS